MAKIGYIGLGIMGSSIARNSKIGRVSNTLWTSPDHPFSENHGRAPVEFTLIIL